MSTFEDIADSIVNMQNKQVISHIQNMLSDGVDPLSIIKNGLTLGMIQVRDGFKNDDLLITEVMLASKTMELGINYIRPLLKGKKSYNGLVVIGTVAGDLHSIGKSLVSIMLEVSNYKVIDLGVDVPTETFIHAVKEYKPDILGMSSLLTSTMQAMPQVIDSLKEEGLRDQVKIIIGGSPVSQVFADQIGADGYSLDSTNAAALCDALMSKNYTLQA